MNAHWFFLIGCAASFLLPASKCVADEFEYLPIRYSASTPNNRVSQFQSQLDASIAKLEYEPQFAYLRGDLKAPSIPVESQVQVYSKTILQVQRISRDTPRAIYFNDAMCLGFCQNGNVFQVSIADSQLGAVFYTLEQPRNKQTVLERQTDNCLNCHVSSRSENFPGHLVRSQNVNTTRQSLISAGSRACYHTPPFAERWGGWYAMDKHNKQEHRSMLISLNPDAMTHSRINVNVRDAEDLGSGKLKCPIITAERAAELFG